MWSPSRKVTPLRWGSVSVEIGKGLGTSRILERCSVCNKKFFFCISMLYLTFSTPRSSTAAST
jgi:hypothetical protein